MRSWPKVIFAVGIGLAPLWSGAQAEETDGAVSKFCVPVEAEPPILSELTPIEVLKLANGILDSGRILTVSREQVTFDGGLPVEPRFSVRVFALDLIVMDRGYVMDGGPKCEAWRRSTDLTRSCNWSFAKLPPVAEGESVTLTMRVVWETLVLHREKLTLTTNYSGEQEKLIQEFACADPADLMRYMRTAE